MNPLRRKMIKQAGAAAAGLMLADTINFAIEENSSMLMAPGAQCGRSRGLKTTWHTWLQRNC